MSMVEIDDIELDFDVFEPSVSAFAELFTEREKMKVSTYWVSKVFDCFSSTTQWKRGGYLVIISG